MERKMKGVIAIVIGAILFIGSMFFILPIEGLYLASLVIMFIAVVLIGSGGALVQGIDSSLDTPSGECHYCEGAGIIVIDGDKKTCPRCGGTGLPRADD